MSLYLTEPQHRALAVLESLCDAPHGTAQQPRGYTVPGDLARALWPDSEGWERRSRRGSTHAQGALGATMPMKAGRMLASLERLGLARRRESGLYGNAWSITEQGRRVVAGEEP